MSRSVRLVGLGGSLRAGWTGRTALQTALDGAQVANAEPSLIWMLDLDLPMYTRESGGAGRGQRASSRPTARATSQAVSGATPTLARPGRRPAGLAAPWS